MALVSQNTHVERQLSTMTNCHSLLNGDVSLTPTNFYENWTWAQVDEDHDPDGIGVGMPDDPDGVWVYVSNVDASPDTLAAQNTNSLPLEFPSFVCAKSWVDGHRPQLTGMFSAPIAPPPPPIVQIVPSNRAGFEATTYYCTYAYVDAQMRCTTVAPAVAVTPSLGQALLFTIPGSLPERAVGVQIFMSTGGGAFYAQRVIDQRFEITETWLHPGPFVFGRLAPSVNESIDYIPREPDVEAVTSSRSMDSGKVSGRSSKVSSGGESRASGASKKMVMSGTKQAVKLSPGSSKSNKKGKKGAKVNVKIYIIQQPDSGESSTGSVSDTSKGSSSRGFAPDESVTTSGQKSGGGGGGGGGKHKKKKKNRHRGEVEDVEAPEATEPIEYDVEETEPPTAPLDPPIPQGSAVMAPGTRLYALSYSVKGKESPLSEIVTATVPAGSMARVVIPDVFNALSNPNLYERDALGQPFDHFFNAGNGAGAVSRATVGGNILLSTGAITHTTQVSPIHGLFFGVNRKLDYRVGVTVSTFLTAGAATVYVAEYDSDDNQIALNALRSVTGSGLVEVSAVFGPSGTPWNANTFQAAIWTTFTGSPRGGDIFLFNFDANLTAIAPRRVELPPFEWRETANPTLDLYAPPPRSSTKAVGPPPQSQMLTPVFPLSVLTFENGIFATDWTMVNTNPAAVSSAVVQGAAIDGFYGWREVKSSPASGLSYLYKAFTGFDDSIAVRTKVRVVTLPTRIEDLNAGVTLCSIKQTIPSTAVDDPGHIASLFLSPWGVLWIVYHTATGLKGQPISIGIFPGSVIDIELATRNVGTEDGQLVAYLGRGGAPRQLLVLLRGIDWSAKTVGGVQVGVDFDGNPSELWHLEFDNAWVTETGAPLTTVRLPPLGTALTLPDRPRALPVDIEPEYTFEDGTIPAAFTQTRTPTTSTTLVVQGASAISGSFGLRCQDANTANTAAIYVQRTLPSARASAGIRWRVRIVARPSTGNITLGRLINAAGQDMARVYIDSVGDLYIQAYALGVARPATRFYAGITNSTVLTLELVAEGAGTISGRISVWMEVGGTGSPNTRGLYYQEQVIDWTSGLFQTARLGIVDESPASATSTIDVDNIRFTTRGEVFFSERSEQGEDINQLYLLYMPGQVPDNSLGPNQRSFAVVPGEDYTIAVKARWNGVPEDNLAQPFFVTAYDTDGEAHELGSPFGDGVSGGSQFIDVPEGDYKLTFIVPEDCYQVDISSKGMGEGQWVFQELCFCKGTEAIREITYPESGQIFTALDTNAAVAGQALDKLPFTRRWSAIGATIQLYEDGGAYLIEFRSAPTPVGPFTPWTVVGEQVPEQRYCQFRVTLTASGDLRETPLLKYNSPFIEYAVMWESEQVAVLLDENMQEFPGGCILGDFRVPYDRPGGFSRILPSGRIKRMKFGNPVGKVPGFTIHTFNEDTTRDIQERCLDIEPWVQARDALYQIKLARQLEFSPASDEEGWRREETDDGDITWLIHATADTGEEVDILEEIPLPRPFPSPFTALP